MADVPLMSNPMTTAGDVIYGGASGAPTRLGVGTAGQVLTVNAGATAPEWAAPGSGGGIVDYAQVKRTAGDLSLTSANWADVPSIGDLTVDAATGDLITVEFGGLYNSSTPTVSMDCATIVSAAGVNWFGSGEPTTSTGNGVHGWGKMLATAALVAFGASATLVVQAGDISGGTVTLRMRYRASSTITLFASTTNPLIWTAKVFRPS